MRDIDAWNRWPKHDMSELEILREENKLLKENLEELQKRGIVDRSCKLSTHRHPALPGTFAAYIVALIAVINYYDIKDSIIGRPFLERLIMWLITFVGCFGIFSIIYVILDMYIFEKIDKISELGFYQKDNERHFKNYIPHISVLILIFVLAILGPQ